MNTILNVEISRGLINNAIESMENMGQAGVEINDATIELYRELELSVSRFVITPEEGSKNIMLNAYSMLQRQMAALVTQHETNQK